MDKKCKKIKKSKCINRFFIGIGNFIKNIKYSIPLFFSIILIGLFFINKESPWCIVSCSIGASLFGAILLAYFIELSNNRRQQKEILEFRKEKLSIINFYLSRILEIILRKFLIDKRSKMIANKKYALQYKDIKQILINECSEKELKYSGKDDSTNERGNDFKNYFDGYALFDTIILFVNKILIQEDILMLNKIFTKEEISLFRSTTFSFPVLDNNSFEFSISNSTSVIDQLLELKELHFLDNCYGVYDYDKNRMGLCDQDGKAVIRPLNIIFNLQEAITNGKELLK